MGDSMSEKEFPVNPPRNLTKLPSNELIDGMVKAYASGRSAMDVGREFGVTAPTVLKWSYRAGVPLRKRGYPPKINTQAIEQAMREAGTTRQLDVAKHLNVTFVTARSAVKRAGFVDWRAFVKSVGLPACGRKKVI